jgi:hypothetical protein
LDLEGIFGPTRLELTLYNFIKNYNDFANLASVFLFFFFLKKKRKFWQFEKGILDSFEREFSTVWKAIS